MLITTRAAPFASSAGSAKTFSGAGGSISGYEFKATLTVDQPDVMPNGFGAGVPPGRRHAADQHAERHFPDFRVDIQGVALRGFGRYPAVDDHCDLIVDATRSTGGYPNTTGGGAFSWSADASSSPLAVLRYFSDNLHF